MKKEILEWIVAIAVAIALIAIITKFVGKSYSIKGDSMDPTLKDGERVVVNIIASLSHIKIKYYFFVLVISKLISITILGVMGKEIFTIFTNPLRALIMIVLLVVLWFISKKVEKHFMGSTKE